MAIENIISSLQQKTGDNNQFVNYRIGAEQRYIGSLQGKNGNNNLEEQLLMGTDKIIVSWKNGDLKREDIEFRNNEDLNQVGFYFINSYILENNFDMSTVDMTKLSQEEKGNFLSLENEIYFDENGSIIFYSSSANIVDEGDNLKLNQIKDNIFSFENDNLNIFIPLKIQKDILYFKRNESSNDNKKKVSEKLTTKEIINGTNKIKTKEIITNSL